MLFLANIAKVVFPSNASLRMPSLAVDKSGFSRTKNTNERIAKYVVYMTNQYDPLSKPFRYMPVVI
jgi:hypothetical protein